MIAQVNFNRIILVLLIFGIFLISYFAFWAYLSWDARGIRKRLAYDGKVNLSELPKMERICQSLCEAEKQDMLEQRGISLHFWRRCLLVGLSSCCDCFIDFSLFRFYLARATETDVSCTILKLMTYFPANIKDLDHLYRTIKITRVLSPSRAYLIFQVYRVKEGRPQWKKSDFRVYIRI
jgi:hypothetical protein